MAPANKNLILSIINFADSCKDIYILFVRNKRGLRKLSTDAQKRLKGFNLACTTNDLRSRSPSPLPGSLNGDCTLLKYSRDLSPSTLLAGGGLFQRLEADGFQNLVNRYTNNSSVLFYDTVDEDEQQPKENTEKDQYYSNNGTNFAQMKCSCGELCSLVNGLTSCCKKSIDDLLYDLFGEMYINRKKAFAIKVNENTTSGQNGGENASSMIYVGSYGSEPDISMASGDLDQFATVRAQ